MKNLEYLKPHLQTPTVTVSLQTSQGLRGIAVSPAGGPIYLINE